MTEYQDPIVYGHNDIPRIVAVEPLPGCLAVTLYQRAVDGTIKTVQVPTAPWLLTSVRHNFSGAQTTELTGDGHRWRVDFIESGWQGFQDARRTLRNNNVPTLSYGSQIKQFLIASGITQFKNMSFDELVRMQVDIETTTLSPAESCAQILLISISDSAGNSEVLCSDERSMLLDLMQCISVWDPDVIEGHNIFSFDLPYILQRCTALGIPFIAGRKPNLSATVGTPRNCAIGANNRPFTPIYLYGRHVIDTYLQVQRFDIAKGQISSYGLKECARVYNIASESRIIIDRSQLAQEFARDPKKVVKYARQDAEETEALSALITPTDFYQSQIVPDAYQNVAVTGNGEKINALLIREYIFQQRSIPLSRASGEYPGGYTEVRRVGVIKPVVKTDVESLYPSLMLTRRIKPDGDSLDIFLTLLSALTKRRLDAKAESKKENLDVTRFSYWDGMQNSFKVLINSFYGYLGGPFYFNDSTAARAVTEAGQKIVRDIADRLEETGSIVIEIDTDGIYFKPPDDVSTYEDELAYIATISAVVPAGIRLAHDGRYAAMLSIKIKNYVLVEYDGRKIMKGSSLRSRADEKFGRNFLNTAVDLVLAEELELLSDNYRLLVEQLLDGHLPIEQIVRRERVSAKSLETQRRAYSDLYLFSQIKEGDIVHTYTRSDGKIALEFEYNFDEDRNYYAQKLYKFALRLIDAVGEDRFNKLFPKPKPAEQRLRDRLQSSFDFEL